MKNWIKNHQKLASVIGLGAFAAVWTGLYFLFPSVDPDTVVTE